jgi:dienelactone hydrolase
MMGHRLNLIMAKTQVTLTVAMNNRTAKAQGQRQPPNRGVISMHLGGWQQLLIAVMVIAIVSTVAPNRVFADADQRASEFLSELQAGDYAKAETHFNGTMQAQLPPAKLGLIWEQLTSAYGRLTSYAITARTEVNGAPLRIVSLDFENGASVVTAQIAFDSLGQIAGLYFVPTKASSADSQLADQRANELVAALQAGNFQHAEAAFNTVMKKALPPGQLESIWRGHAGSFGALKSWQIAERKTVADQQVRIVNLTFEKAANAFALQIAISPTGEVSGFYFVNAVSLALPSPAVAYIKPALFRSERIMIGSGALALPGTLTVPVGPGPFPAALLVQGSGPNDRDETVGAEKPFRDLAQGLSSQGIAALRYDKRTCAHPTSIDLLHLTVDTEVIDDAISAIGLLRYRPEIDHRRIFIIGHSLGAELAPEIAARAGGIAGVIMLAPPDRPLPRIIVDEDKYLGASPSKLRSDTKAAHLLLTKSLPPTSMAFGAPASYFYDLDARDSISIARSLRMPILILRGARDYQVTSGDIAAWRKGLSGVANVRFETLPNLNHLFIAGTGKPSPSEYLVPGHVAPAPITIIASFIRERE